jgi:pyruvate dehydrogenase (quinone)
MVTQALNHDGPALVDIVVNMQELLIPPSVNLEEAKGFTVHMMGRC